MDISAEQLAALQKLPLAYDTPEEPTGLYVEMESLGLVRIDREEETNKALLIVRTDLGSQVMRRHGLQD
ncbi:MAG: hypothetical protein EOO09_08180 [Chitinophagaceae bacterium]|nr:MAG: hypothetical protein EOO09_08180 [Chitinophagaceae bacterium]